MGLTIASAGDVLKIDYLPPVRDQLNNSNVLQSRINRNSEDVVGKHAYVPLHIARNSGIGVRAENGTLPTAGAQSYTNATYGMTYHYSRINVSGPTIEAMKNDEGAFVRAVDSEIKGAVKDIQRDVNRQMWGDGTGIMAMCNAAADEQLTITCDSIHLIEAGMRVDLISSNAGAGSQTYQLVSAVIEKTCNLVLSITQTNVTSGTTAVYRHGNRNKEMNGLDAAVSTGNPRHTRGNFGAIDRTAAAGAFWQCNALTAASHRPLSLDLMQQGMDESDKHRGKVSVVLTNYILMRAYADKLLPDRRFDESMTLDGGWKALNYDGVPLVRDRDANLFKMYFLDESTLQLYEMSDWDWMDKDGAVLCRVADTDAYEATLRKYMNLGGDQGNANTVLCDLGHTF